MQLTHDGRVKLADVGVAKQEKDITGTVCGTPLYLAPEVYSGHIYNSKADMYSFGFVLWELWYGERAFQAALVTKPVSYLLADILKRELRPTHIEGTCLPWEIWRNVMMSCWSKEPRVRPTAQRGWECLEELQELGRNQELAPPLPPRSSSAPKPLSPRNKAPAVKPKPASKP